MNDQNQIDFVTVPEYSFTGGKKSIVPLMLLYVT